QPMTGLPLVLHEQRELLVADVRRAGSITGDAVGTAALQIKQQRAAGCGGPRRTRCRRGDVAPVRAADRVRPEPARRRRRRVAEKTGHAVEDVAALEKAAEYLRIVRVQPLTAGLHGVPSGADGKVVIDLDALD